MDAETARDKARKRLAESKLDGLPTRKKDAPPKSVLFRDYVEEFLEDYARHWKPSTTYRNKHAITQQLLPVFGDVPLASITRADVMRWRDGMASRSGTFNRILPVLAVMLGYAEQLGYRRKGSNPCRGTPRFKRALPERYLSPAEFRRLATMLREAEEEFPIAVAVIRLLIYTGARAGEIKGLRWEYIKPPRIMLPDSKTGPKTIYLNRQAMAVGAALEDLKRDRLPHATALLVIALTGCRKSEILGLTWNEVKGRRLLLHDSKTGPRTVWMGDEARALLDALPRHPRHNRVFWHGEYDDLDSSVYFHFQAARVKAGLPKIRIHDLRHSFASHAAAMVSVA